MGPLEAGIGWTVQTRQHQHGWHDDDFTSPVLDIDGTSFVGGSDGRLVAVDRYGSVRWTFPTGGKIEASPVILSSGNVLVGSDNGWFYAVNPDGSDVWAIDLGAGIRTSAAVTSDGVAYVGADDGRLSAVNVSDGTLLWQHSLGCGRVRSSPTFTPDSRIVLAADDGTIYSLTLDGDVIWTFQPDGRIDGNVASDVFGNAYFATDEGKVYALAPDGTEMWDSSLGQHGSHDGHDHHGSDDHHGWDDHSAAWLALAPNDTLRVAHSSGLVEALSMSGQSLWTFQAFGSIRNAPSVGSDGSTYFATTAGFVFAISPTGQREFVQHADAPITTTPAIADNGTLVVADERGKVQSIGTPLAAIPTIDSPASHVQADGPLPIHVDVPVSALPASLPACPGGACSYALDYELNIAQEGTLVSVRTLYGEADVDSSGDVTIDASWDYTDDNGLPVADDAFTVSFGYDIRASLGPNLVPLSVASNYAVQPDPPVDTEKTCDLIGTPSNVKGAHAFNWSGEPNSTFPLVTGTDEGQPFIFQGHQFFAFGDTGPIDLSKPDNTATLNPDNNDIMAVVHLGSTVQHDNCLKLDVLGREDGVYQPTDLAAPVTVDGPYATGGKWMGALSIPGKGFAFTSMGDKLFATMPGYTAPLSVDNVFIPCDQTHPSNSGCPGVNDVCFVPPGEKDALGVTGVPICMHGGCDGPGSGPCCTEQFPANCVPRLRPSILATGPATAGDLIADPKFTSVKPETPSAGNVTVVDGSYLYTMTTNREVANGDTIKFYLQRQTLDANTGALRPPTYVDGSGNDSELPVTIINDSHKIVSGVSLAKVGNVWVLLYGGRLPYDNALYNFAFSPVTMPEFTDKEVGFYVRTAPHPWGQWSNPVTVYSPYSPNHPNAGYCEMLHDDTPAVDCKGSVTQPGSQAYINAGLDLLPPDWPLSHWGYEYGPGIVQSESASTFDQLSLSWVMSTWNPYRVVLMHTTMSLVPMATLRSDLLILLQHYYLPPQFLWPDPRPKLLQ
jgi:outer membrane protein assembly factor BamB